MKKLVVVGISDQQIAAPPDILITYALGSCVGICIYDFSRRMGGLSHILLPEAFANFNKKDVYKFANTAIAALVSAMERKGCLRAHMTAKIAGGANMFTSLKGINIGERNVKTVKEQLQKLKIRIVAEDTGANYGRTVEFDPENGMVTVKTAERGQKIL
ncbi:MAG: chemotaxis protein CheD [Bacillota bacterium]